MKDISERAIASQGLKTVDRTYLKLKGMVIRYEILPGEQIMIEAVANRLSVSITPVREALNRLLHEGLVVQIGGRGFQNRLINYEELVDLLQLRGALAISAIHFLLASEMRHKIEEIFDESAGGEHSDENLPVCRRVLYAVGNRECLRIYENVRDKMHYVWGLYAASCDGAAQIRNYSNKLEVHLRARDLRAALDVIYDNISKQTRALDHIIPYAIGRLYSDSARTVMRPDAASEKAGQGFYSMKDLSRTSVSQS